jgi:phosphoserine phosphatase
MVVKRDIKLAVFDFDSTLMDGETIDRIAEKLGLEERVAEITERAMRGELSFFDSLQERVGLLKGLSVEAVDEVCQNLPFIDGGKELIGELKSRGATVVCFSGGFRNATSPAKDILGYDADFSNRLHSENGVLTGKVGGDMMFDFSKGDMLQRLQDILGISRENTLVVGDGANDLSMFKGADHRVAFCAKPVLKAEANIVIEEKNLLKIAEYL